MHTPKISLVISMSLILFPTIGSRLLFQKKSEPATRSALCNRDIALDTIREQIAFTKTFEQAAQRINILIRAADLLWPYQQSRAQAAFLEAFDLAKQDHNETGDEMRREGVGLFSQPPDRRYTVIAAISKRDRVWARKLSEQMLEDDAREAETKPAQDAQTSSRTNEKLLTLASGLLTSEETAALSFARTSLSYAASLQVPIFLYKLAEVNRNAADQFYQEVLSAYASAPMDQFLYLSSYAFANNREAGEMPGYTIYRLPEGFAPNPALQRLFVKRILARTQIEGATETIAGRRLSEAAQMWLALTRLQKQIESSLPDLSVEVEQARVSLFGMIPQASQGRVGELIAAQDVPRRSFDELIEAAEKLTDPTRREQQLVSAILRSPASESYDRIIKVIDGLSEPELRRKVLNWFSFFRAQRMIKDKNLDDARKLAANVSELDQRAYLYSRIAEESLKQTGSQAEARAMLDEVAAAAQKSPGTIVTARALLNLAELYSKIDVLRAIELLGDAIKCINRLNAPDFSQQYVTMKIEIKTQGNYASYQTPGNNPENVFRELGKLDFDGTLYQAANFTDKSLRSLTTLALVEPCLMRTSSPKGKSS